MPRLYAECEWLACKTGQLLVFKKAVTLTELARVFVENDKIFLIMGSEKGHKRGPFKRASIARSAAENLLGIFREESQGHET